MVTADSRMIQQACGDDAAPGFTPLPITPMRREFDAFGGLGYHGVLMITRIT